MKTRIRKSPQSIDGFVSRGPGNAPGTGGTKRRTLNDFSSTRSTKAIEFQDTWSKDDVDTLQIAPLESQRPHASTDSKGKDKNKKSKGLFRRGGKKPPLTKKQKIKRTLLIVGALLLIIGGFFAWRFLLNTGKIFNGNVLGFFDTTRLRGEDEGRVNILLAGTSEGDAGHQGADLTDSIMVVSLDTKDNTALTFSIPRDTWVDYGRACSSGYAGKINAVYQCGKTTKFKEEGYPEGGMGLLQKVVTENFGIKMHYYGKINYKAFKDAVNAVGGINVTIDSDDPRGIYDPNFQAHEGGPLRLSNGKHVINGVTALRLARSRNSAGGYGMTRGDFDRTNYQQAMLVALKNKALSGGTLINPAKMSKLLDAAGNNVKTNFKTNELRRLYELAKLINSEKITSVDLASEEVNLLTTDMYSGQSIVRPVAGLADFTQIQRYLRRRISTNPIIKEDAKIVVLNGSGVAGLAQKRADELSAKELNIIAVGNGTTRKGSIVIDKTNGKKPKTSALLQKTIGVDPVTNMAKYPEAKKYQADFIVIVAK